MGRPEPLGGSPSPDLHKLPTPVRMAMDVEANQSTSPEELLRRHTSHRDSAGQRSSERASDNEDNRSETSEEKVEDESYTTQKRMMRLMRSTVVVATSRTHQVSLLQSCLRYPGKSWRAFKKRGYIISHESSWVNAWDWCLMILILYTAIIAPLVLVFEELRWDLGSIDYDSFANAMDFVFLFDVLIKARTSYEDHGYEVLDPKKIFERYFRTFFLVDLASGFPFGLLLVRSGDEIRIISLVRLLRIARLLRKLDSMSGANWMRVVQMMLFFLLLGHWFGLVWYLAFIKPLERQTRDELEMRLVDMGYNITAEECLLETHRLTCQEAALGYPSNEKGLTATDSDRGEWYWIISDIDPDIESVRIRWVCSLYWALSVMTNLKAIPAHEARECMRWKADVEHPFLERVFTIMIFVIGAVFYSIIYGNINQFIESMYASGHRYRKRMDEINEFVHFHGLPPSLQHKIRSYVQFAYSVTKGINVESISQQLPAHLQLEIHLHLNKKMVEQVKIFSGCPKDFFKALVMKLQPCICVAGDFVFRFGEKGDRMYFVKRGMAEVLNREGKGIHSFKEHDYFGEIALLSDQPRTADVRAVSDCMMLSLELRDFEVVLKMFPQARSRIELTAQERFRQLLRSDTASLKMRSGGRAGSPLANSPSWQRESDNRSRSGLSRRSGSSTRDSHDDDSVHFNRERRRSSGEHFCSGPMRIRRESNEGSPSPNDSPSPTGFRRRISISNLVKGFTNSEVAEHLSDERRSSFRRRSGDRFRRSFSGGFPMRWGNTARVAPREEQQLHPSVMRRKSDPSILGLAEAQRPPAVVVPPGGESTQGGATGVARRGTNPESPDFLDRSAAINSCRHERRSSGTEADITGALAQLSTSPSKQRRTSEDNSPTASNAAAPSAATSMGKSSSTTGGASSQPSESGSDPGANTTVLKRAGESDPEAVEGGGLRLLDAVAARGDDSPPQERASRLSFKGLSGLGRRRSHDNVTPRDSSPKHGRPSRANNQGDRRSDGDQQRASSVLSTASVPAGAVAACAKEMSAGNSPASQPGSRANSFSGPSGRHDVRAEDVRQRSGSFFMMADPNDSASVEHVASASRDKGSLSAEVLSQALGRGDGGGGGGGGGGGASTEEVVEALAAGFEKQMSALRQDLTVVFKIMEQKLTEVSNRTEEAESKNEERLRDLRSLMTDVRDRLEKGRRSHDGGGSGGGSQWMSGM